LRLFTLRDKIRDVSKYVEDFPQNTWPVDQPSELQVTKLAASILQPQLDKLISSNRLIRTTFGADYVASRPTSKVREAETIMLVQLLKSINEVTLIAANPDLFEKILQERTLVI